ncbi:MAG: hypothetical protein ACYS32_01795 [Planctomycetota bacterium]|jgi:hypothetical protein
MLNFRKAKRTVIKIGTNFLAKDAGYGHRFSVLFLILVTNCFILFPDTCLMAESFFGNSSNSCQWTSTYSGRDGRLSKGNSKIPGFQSRMVGLEVRT